MSLGGFIGSWSWTTCLLLHCNESSGDLADSSGNSNTASVTYITMNPWRIWWKSAWFNGSSSKLIIANNANLNLTWDQTYVMRVKLSSQPLTWLQFRLRDNSGSSPYGMYISYVEGTWMKLAMAYSSAASTVYPQTLTNWVRYMLWFVHSDTSDYDEIFVNGVSIWKATWKTANPAVQNKNKYIWVEGDGSVKKWFPWDIDEVIIENRGRTPTMMQKHYTYTKWRFWII